MKSDYDVIVVGGRVAGASTAMLLARCGHRVLIVERSPMPADTVSTHAIMRTGVLQLSRWGMIDRLERLGTPPIRAMTLGFGDERIDSDLSPDFGVDRIYAPRRHVFDQMMLDAAAEAGADVTTRTRATGLLQEADRVNGLEVRTATGRSRVTARFVVGADGTGSRVATMAGAQQLRSHPQLNAVHYAYYTGIDQQRCWFQFSPGVNAGLIPTNDSQTLVFVGRPTAWAPRFLAEPEAEFHRLLNKAGSDLAARVRHGSRVSRFSGTRGLTGVVRRPTGPGWVLVGDAGYVKDPISAHGMSQALRDAELAARAIDTALTEPGRTSRAMAEYASRRDALSAVMFDQSQKLAEYRWNADEASRRMRRISESIREECAALVALPVWAPLGHAAFA